MTGVTGIRCTDMVCGFTTGAHTIMATDTGAVDLAMIHRGWRHWRPVRREYGVASLAHIGTIDVIGRFTAGGDPIVTALAVTRHFTVLHRDHRCPR
jgi:hypothetical protein